MIYFSIYFLDIWYREQVPSDTGYDTLVRLPEGYNGAKYIKVWYA